MSPLARTLSQCSRLEEAQSGRLRRHLLQQLNPLGPLLLPDVYCAPGDIAAWPRQAWHDSGLDRKGEDADDRNCGCCRFEIEGEVCGNANDHIRIAAHDVASQVCIVRGSSVAGISLNQKILPPCPKRRNSFKNPRRNGVPSASVILLTGNEG